MSTDILPHLFKTEYSKIIAVLCKRFGFDHVETAEDITSEAFLTAVQTWGINGVPKNPAAWLYHVAGNKAKNYLQRNHTFESRVVKDLESDAPEIIEEIDLSPQNIIDSQLQMIFAVCHPSISPEAQIGLSLRILCGFGIDEIAAAFISNKETINKRLFRAKEKLRSEKIEIEFPPSNQIDDRLASVLTTIYLLFNEGYYSVSKNNTLRRELCFEAMRLCTMLVENPPTNRPQVNALLSLMCFHASRFDARVDKNGELILYEEQDANLWNDDLISKGGYLLKCAAVGETLSKYHLEAGIAYWNTQKTDAAEKWENILQLYNRLLQLEYSTVAALNRTYALSKARGKEIAIAEAEKLNLTGNYFYYALLGELYSDIDNKKAHINFEEALKVAKTTNDKLAIRKRMEKL